MQNAVVKRRFIARGRVLMFERAWPQREEVREGIRIFSPSWAFAQKTGRG
jgi:hypothetical protein